MRATGFQKRAQLPMNNMNTINDMALAEIMQAARMSRLKDGEKDRIERCRGCYQWRLCREYKNLWLCRVRCYRKRRMIWKVKQHP